MKSPVRYTHGDTVNIHSHLQSESQSKISHLRSRLNTTKLEKKEGFDDVGLSNRS